MEKKEIAICRDCGEEILGDFVEIDGEYVCQDCFDDKYFYCDDCGTIEEKDYGYWIDSCDRFVCENCFDRNYFKCADCGEYFSFDDTYYNINQDYYVCDCCYSNGDYCYCDGCGNYYESGLCHWHNDYCYCDNCYEEESGGMYDYHEFNDWVFFKGSNEERAPYFFGKEIELEPKGYSNVSGVINAIENNINAVGMHDGSLADGGVEVVTHPESWEYLQEHKQNYINFFEEIKNLDYGNDGGCGLHFHVSRPNENVIARVIVLLESFKSEIKKLSRRSDTQLRSWAKFLTDSGEEDSIKYQSMKYLKDKYVKGWHDRYYALNLQNDKTIEFRFFNGVNTFEQFWGALQFIHNIMEIALDEEKDITTVSWKDLLVGDELLEQARKRDVLTIDKKAKDTTDILEKLEKQKQELKDNIKKTLNNMIKYIYKNISDEKLETISNKDIVDIRKGACDFVNTISDKLSMLNSTISFYNSVDNYTISSIKSDKEWLRRQVKGNYERYFKQIDKHIANYEKEAR